MADNEDISPVSPKDDAPDNPLTDEQEEALNKILAELEGAKEKDDEATPAEDNEDTVAKDQAKENADGLTDEQEEALQKIMAEIEGTSKDPTEPDSSPSSDSITAEQEETLNKIVAELQDDSPPDKSDEADIAEKEPATDKDSDENSQEEPSSEQEDLSSEQEEALQKIMAEIESKSDKDTTASESPASDEAAPENNDSPVLQENEPQSQSQDEPTEKDEDRNKEKSDKVFEELDLSDFESELKKVVSEANTQTAQAPKPRRTSKLEVPKKLEKPKEKETASGPPAEPSSSKDPENSEKIPPPEASKALKSEKDKEATSAIVSPPLEQIQKADKKPPQETTQPVPEDAMSAANATPSQMKTTAPVLDDSKKDLIKKIVICCVALTSILIIAMVIRWVPNLFSTKEDRKITSIANENQKMEGADEESTAFSKSQTNQPPDLAQVHREALTAILKEIKSQRTFILGKIKEVNELQSYYEQGIFETEEDLIDRIRDKKIIDLKGAVADQKVEFGIRTIQRRKAYISRLHSPFERLVTASEELLYLERKTDIFLEMIENTSGINLDPFEKQANEALSRINSAQKDLSIDQSTAYPDSIGAIWEDLLVKVKNSTNKKISSSKLEKQNELIWKEICSGNFTRKWALTQLNEKTANCLLQWDGKDLYLNRLTELSPEVAQILSHWPGEWLGLNGLKNLSSETARHLARWKGKRLSLNGLSELSPKATLYLSKWQGDQLELIGLKHIGQWENPNVKLFLSDKLRDRLPK